jgi:alkylated DNA repair dioxygenase AlkB
MDLVVQGSLFDAVGAVDSLAGGAPDAVPALVDVPRVDLGLGAWVDLLPGWLRGADSLFDRLLEAVPWAAERRRMYERVVDVPRLLAFYAEIDELPDPVLTRCRDALNAHYATDLGEPLLTAGLCLYRDGRDSVAWHGDTIGRGRSEDTVVAIVSLGAPRQLALRPLGGTTRHRFSLGHGDLVVMGGSCQRTWEHAVLKTAKAVGPRISVQFRPRGVR